MAQPQIVYGIAVPVSAGDGGARVIQSTMKLAGVIAAVMTVNFIVDMAYHASLLGTDMASSPQDWAGTVIGFLICGLAVPFFGWWGAKNKDQSWLSAFCIGERDASIAFFCAVKRSTTDSIPEGLQLTNSPSPLPPPPSNDSLPRSTQARAALVAAVPSDSSRRGYLPH